MASAPIEFQRKLTLRHIATVKTIQMLWRQSDSREDLKTLFISKLGRSKKSEESENKILTLVTAKLESSLEKLNIPGGMKNDLSVFLVEMIAGAVIWLTKTVDDMILHEDRNCFIKVEHFVDNLSWDDVGCIDGPSILQSYVNTKDTIDFDTWNQLCFYCIEEDINKFSKTLDWDNCRKFTKSYFPIFWYRKIYGKFPAKKMFRSREFFLVFENERRRGVYNKENIIQNLISESVFEGSIPAVKYFRNTFQHDDEFQRLFSEGGVFFTAYPAMMVYLLGEVKNEALLQSFCTSDDEFTSLLKWPWILFIDTWISKIENMMMSHFRMLFEGIHSLVILERDKVGIPEFRRIQSRGLYGTRFYEPFRKLWAIFHQKFGAGNELAKDYFWTFFGEEDLTFCGIIFEGLEEQERRLLLDTLKDFMKIYPSFLHNKDFFCEFVRKVLVSDEEKKFFEGISSC